jgi:paraquat-inducible protein A
LILYGVAQNDRALSKEQEVVCHECAHQVLLPNLEHKQSALCPRCGFNLTTYYHQAMQKVIALASAALIFLFCSLPFEFLSFSASGQDQSIGILAGLWILVEFDYALLAILQGVAILGLPCIILCGLLYLVVPLSLGYRPAKARLMIKLLFALLPWTMAEIFLVGVLVSLVKIMSMADIGLGLSFYAYIGFTLCLTVTLTYVDKHQLSQWVDSNYVEPHSAINKSQSVQTTWALLMTSILFYIPANLLPIMHTSVLGSPEPSTIFGGVVLLWKMGSYPIAIIIFIASVFVPVAKLIILCWLNYTVQKGKQQQNSQRMYWYRITEFVGRWSMVDVFVVAILVSLIQLGNIMSIVPGYAALAFCAVVICTMLAAMSFDPRLIWDQSSTPHNQG